MEFRSAVFNNFGTIDAEIKHPELGWIPCTFSPDDEATTALFHLAAENAQPYVEPEE